MTLALVTVVTCITNTRVTHTHIVTPSIWFTIESMARKLTTTTKPPEQQQQQQQQQPKQQQQQQIKTKTTKRLEMTQQPNRHTHMYGWVLWLGRDFRAFVGHRICRCIHAFSILPHSSLQTVYVIVNCRHIPLVACRWHDRSTIYHRPYWRLYLSIESKVAAFRSRCAPESW